MISFLILQHVSGFRLKSGFKTAVPRQSGFKKQKWRRQSWLQLQLPTATLFKPNWLQIIRSSDNLGPAPKSTPINLSALRKIYFQPFPFIEKLNKQEWAIPLKQVPLCQTPIYRLNNHHCCCVYELFCLFSAALVDKIFFALSEIAS